jgi:hypothetical protein
MIDPCPVPIHDWWYWHPPVGSWIAVLAVLGVLVPLYRQWDAISRREKAIWTAMMFALVGFELWGLHLDRDEHDAEQSQARCEQIERFGQIASELEASIKESEKQFALTSTGLGKTLQATNTTIKQTQPHAFVLVLGFELLNPPVPPQLFQAATKYNFNLPYSNDGSEPAKVSRRLAEIYVGKPDDVEAQTKLSREFEKVWGKTPNTTFANLVKNAPQYWTETREFTDNEIKQMSEHPYTVYVLSRIQYRDSTGTWWTDRCEHIQLMDRHLYLHVTRPCRIFSDSRYRALGK